MAQTAIFGPVFATMLLTLLVWVYMYIRRIRFIIKNNINPKDLAVRGALAQLSPAAVSNPSDILKKLFRDSGALLCASAVAVRHERSRSRLRGCCVEFRSISGAMHSAVHCTINLVMLRFYLYLIATLAVWLMLIRALLNYLGG